MAVSIEVCALTTQQYIALIKAAPAAGIRGGSFFDAVRAQAARETHCDKIRTLNVRHFRHVAPDLTVLGL